MPIEEVSRPITLPQNMSEVTIDPHMQVSPYEGSTSLRARYGITPKVQIGLRTMKKPGVTLGLYQEAKIRHFHTLLDEWLSR